MQAQGAQTEIDWVETVSESSPPQRRSAPAAEPEQPADAQGLRLRVGASLFSRYELRRNYDGIEPIALEDRIRNFDAVAYRARIALRTERIALAKGLGVDLAVVPQASGFWAPSGGDEHPVMTLYEGYFRTLFGERSYLQLGRFAMSYGDEWLIGANDWHQAGRSFDGVRFHLGARKNAAFFDAFLTLLREGRSPFAATTSDDRIGSGDQMLAGMYGDLGPLIAENFHFDPYVLLLINPESRRYYPSPDEATPVRRDAAYEGTFGLRIKGRYGVLDYRIEGGLQYGKRAYDAVVVRSAAGAVDAELGFNLPLGIRIAGSGFFASGDDPTTEKDEGWADRFSQPHKWLGFADMFRTRTNVLGGAAFLSVTPIDSLEFGVQGYLFAKHRATPLDDPAADPTARYAGTEIDPYIGVEFAPGLILRSEYAVFMPSRDVYVQDRAAHYLGVQFGYVHP